jgi:UDP:flavonoid glycosyltransferase YjiC (YdhE family)
MLALAHALRDRGHDVSWAAYATVCTSLRDAGFAADEAGLPEGITSQGLADRHPEIMSLPPHERPDFLFAKIFGAARAAPMLDELLPIVHARDPQLLVCDQAELAGPIAANVVGVPHVTHGFGHPLPEVRLVRAGEEMAPLWEAHGLEARPYAGTYDHLYLDIYPGSLKTEDSPHIEQLLPTRPATRAAAQDTGWGDDERPLVYLTFGTVFNSDVALIGTVIEGLRALPVRVVVTVGPGRDPAALGEQPENVHVAPFIPQAEVLPHCAVVASHAGSGTFLAALAHGLPQLLLPQAADQFLNAAAGARAGVGLAIAPADITAEAVTQATAALLQDPSYREAAQRLSAEIHEMPGPAAVAQELERRFG